jgi:hypothetical protein
MDEQQEYREFYVDTFVARQPVFDAVGNVWGYEILYRDGVEAVSAEFPDPGSAPLAVTAGICLCREHDLKVGKKILINFDEKTILDGVAPGPASGQHRHRVPSRPRSVPSFWRP